MENDITGDGLADNILNNMSNLNNSGRFACGENNDTGNISCYFGYGTTSNAVCDIMYDNIGDGSGTTFMPISMVKKLFAPRDNNIVSSSTNASFHYAVMQDNSVVFFTNYGTDSYQAKHIKYSIDGTALWKTDRSIGNTTLLTRFGKISTSINDTLEFWENVIIKCIMLQVINMDMLN